MCKISVNILNFNTYEKSRACILSVLEQNYANLRILLVDNASVDDSLSKLKEEFEGKVDFLKNTENFGYAGGNNIAVRKCLEEGYEYCFLLNSDTVLKGADLISEMMNVMLSEKDCAILAPVVYNVTSKGLQPVTNESGYLNLLRKSHILPPVRRRSDCLTELSEAQGSALMVNIPKFIAAGGFPEHYFMYSEESTLCKKILWRNDAILCYENEENYVLHYHDKTGHVDNWRVYLMGRNRALEYYENRKIAPFRWFFAFHIFLLQYRMRNKQEKIYYKGCKDAKKLQKSEHYKEDCINAAKRAVEEIGN